MWLGTGLELMVRRLRRGIVGILGAKDPHLGVVPWAGWSLPSVRSLHSHAQWSQPAMGFVPWIPWRLKGVRVVQRGGEACEGLHLEPAASMDRASSWAVLLMLECHVSLLIMAGSVEFHLSFKAPHVLLLRPPAQPSI